MITTKAAAGRGKTMLAATHFYAESETLPEQLPDADGWQNNIGEQANN